MPSVTPIGKTAPRRGSTTPPRIPPRPRGMPVPPPKPPTHWRGRPIGGGPTPIDLGPPRGMPMPAPMPIPKDFGPAPSAPPQQMPPPPPDWHWGSGGGYGGGPIGGWPFDPAQQGPPGQVHYNPNGTTGPSMMPIDPVWPPGGGAPTGQLGDGGAGGGLWYGGGQGGGGGYVHDDGGVPPNSWGGGSVTPGPPMTPELLQQFFGGGDYNSFKNGSSPYGAMPPQIPQAPPQQGPQNLQNLIYQIQNGMTGPGRGL